MIPLRKGEKAMKLATSTGDFWWYVSTVPEMVKCFQNTKFRNINLELGTKTPAFYSEKEDDWKRFADELAIAREEAGVHYVVAHAPCLHNPIPNALQNPDNETYRMNIRALRRAIEVCHSLNIDRVVVHACASQAFSVKEFYQYNKMFYGDLLDLAEKYNITIMTENWDDSATHFSTGKELRDFIDDMEHPLLAACWDTAHGNIDPVAREIGQYENILVLGDKLKGMHISDNFGDCHHHNWPFAGIINFDSIMQGLLDVKYDGYFTFEASYTLLHQNNMPYHRKPWEHNGQTVTKLLNPSLDLKKKAVDLLYETGKYILESYDCFEE